MNDKEILKYYYLGFSNGIKGKESDIEFDHPIFKVAYNMGELDVMCELRDSLTDIQLINEIKRKI